MDSPEDFFGRGEVGGRKRGGTGKYYIIQLVTLFI
jgi:hypothetical protein